MLIIVSTSSFLYGYIDGTSSEIKVALKREAVRTASAACSCASVCVGINFTLCRCHTYARRITCSPARIITLASIIDCFLKGEIINVCNTRRAAGRFIKISRVFPITMERKTTLLSLSLIRRTNKQRSRFVFLT